MGKYSFNDIDDKVCDALLSTERGRNAYNTISTPSIEGLSSKLVGDSTEDTADILDDMERAERVDRHNPPEVHNGESFKDGGGAVDTDDFDNEEDLGGFDPASGKTTYKDNPSEDYTADKIDEMKSRNDKRTKGETVTQKDVSDLFKGSNHVDDVSRMVAHEQYKKQKDDSKVIIPGMKSEGVYDAPINLNQKRESFLKDEVASDILTTKCGVDIGGELKNITREEIKLRFTNIEAKDTIGNTDRLQQKLMKELRSRVGGWSRVTSFGVVDGQIVINGVIHAPKIANNLNKADFVSNTVECIEDGTLIYLFDWYVLKYCGRLREIYFDVDYSIDIAENLNKGKAISYEFYFNYFNSLNTLTIGRDTVTRAEFEESSKTRKRFGSLFAKRDKSKDSDAVKKCDKLSKKIEKKQSSSDISKTFSLTSLMQGIELSPKAGTQAMQNYFTGNLSNYANNRGDKGILLYSGGVAVRSALAVVGGALNFSTHLATGICKWGRKKVNPDYEG